MHPFYGWVAQQAWNGIVDASVDWALDKIVEWTDDQIDRVYDWVES